ncbi:MAG TPA: TIM barrel protein [Candidatus Hydrogenedentes bacterium]|nr:TIM barrel protein [Candidatus Hydrogenedentota bacterium]HPG65492.1 TIM barrel protein [Candidatus Hydrogenedentota bacterium]
MAGIRVGNAPCSWGSLEFDGLEGEAIGYAQMLDELAETGYAGTELGDWGFMPTDAGALRAELDTRGLTMLGAFVPVALKYREAHAPGADAAVKVARLLAAVAGDPKPFLVLADDNGTVPQRTENAGRVTPEMALTDAEWRVFGEGVDAVARRVFDETGLLTVFHHHCAGYVETPDEIQRLLDRTNPDRVSLVFDTGHYVFGAGGGNAMDGLRRFAGRVRYVHFKDCSPEIAQRARQENWDYFASVRHGVFCELGKGSVDFPSVVGWLRGHAYDGFICVEQDVLPGMGMPRESARRNREYLRSIGL